MGLILFVRTSMRFPLFFFFLDPCVYLFPVYRDFLWGFYADLDLIQVYPKEGYLNIVTNTDGLALLLVRISIAPVSFAVV